jgi:hypothetical protein
MMKESKSKWLLVRVTPQEKDEILEQAKRNGFDKLSTYVLWCVRKQKILRMPA